MARTSAADAMGIGLPFEGRSGRIISGSGWLARLARRYARWQYFSVIERHVRPGARVLEFGSGGGDAWLGTRYTAIGLELAFRSAAESARTYGRAINADIRTIPLRDGSVDAVVSSFVLEHLDDRTAERGFAEIHRVLSPGGVFISLCDLESDHPMLCFVRRRWSAGYEEAYREVPGHIGLRRMDDWKRLLVRSGFRIDEWSPISRLPVLDHGPWCQLAASDCFPPGIRRIGSVAYALSTRGRTAMIWGLVVAAADEFLRPLMPERWAYRLSFVARP